jgi:alpha-D-ribose 1-methylphosphonate 5-triphosphate synthase subunit PhnL
LLIVITLILLKGGSIAAKPHCLAELRAQGVAMIGVFHHPEDVAHLIDEQIEMSASHPLLQDATLEEI